MEKIARNLYIQCVKIAGEIDQNGVILENNFSAREQLRIDVRNFLCYIGIADGGIINKEELRYINGLLDYDFGQEQLLNCIHENRVNHRDFLDAPPISLKYFLRDKKITDVVYHSKYYDIRRLFYQTFQELGREFIACDRHVSDVEVARLTRYLLMLEAQINAFSRYGDDRVEVPDTIPYQLKTQKEETADEEIPFVGRISRYDQEEQTLEELLQELDGLIGLDSVKLEVRNLINLIQINKLREENGLKKVDVAKHMVFTGNPGTGKTTIARLLSRIYYTLGILSQGHLVEVDRSGLVAGYMGQTALKVKQVVDKAKGGILFIDEAYSLSNGGPQGDYGQEAIDTLNKAMEDYREDMVVIVAGYPEEMKDFIQANPGLKSRFNRFIHFPDYEIQDLEHIFEYMANQQQYQLSPSAKGALRERLQGMVTHRDKTFGNARDIRNYLGRVVERQANRLIKQGACSKELLLTLEAEDVFE